MSHIINNLDSNTSNWETIGKINKDDKIKVSGTSIGNKGVGTVSISNAGAFQGISRLFSHALNNTLVDSKSTAEWLSHFQAKNLSDLQVLHEHVERTTNKSELEPLLNSLLRMKSTLGSSNKGFQHLAETYGNEREYRTDISMKVAIEEKMKVNEVVAERVDKEIAHIKEKLIAETYTSTVPGQLPVKGNTADSQVRQVKEYAVGNLLGSNETEDDVIIKDKEGNEIKIPAQFAKDLPRTPLFQLNSQTIYSMNDPNKYDLLSTYESLHKALGSSDGATRAIMHLTTQGMLADGAQHTMYMGIKEGELPKYAKGIVDFPQKNYVKIEGDKVSITLYKGYSIGNMNDPEAPPEGYRLVKREFELSLKELQEVGKDQEKSVETVSAKDTYSTLIKDLDNAVNLYKVF